MLHIGAYDQVRGAIAQMYDFTATEKLVANGIHHEIYLSDPRRVASERLRTILRLPVKKA